MGKKGLVDNISSMRITKKDYLGRSGTRPSPGAGGQVYGFSYTLLTKTRNLLH